MWEHCWDMVSSSRGCRNRWEISHLQRDIPVGPAWKKTPQLLSCQPTADKGKDFFPGLSSLKATRSSTEKELETTEGHP